MNVYLCGQKYFGGLALEMVIAEGHTIAGVSAPPGDRLWAAAERLGLPLLPAGRLNAETLPANIDLIVCAHSHDFIGRKTRNAVKLGAIGYHPSLLPLHRGRDAVRWAVKQRDRVTGGTVYWLNDTVDGGPIAAQRHVFVRSEWTAEELWRESLQPLGVELLRKALRDIAGGLIVRVPQDHRLATWEPSLTQPPLYRPDLPQLGLMPDGYRVLVDSLDEMAVLM